MIAEKPPNLLTVPLIVAICTMGFCFLQLHAQRTEAAKLHERINNIQAAYYWMKAAAHTYKDIAETCPRPAQPPFSHLEQPSYED